MNENFMGMDPELAKVAMNKIKSKKNELDTESRNATSALRDKVNSAFAGSQTASMQGFIDRIKQQQALIISWFSQFQVRLV